MAKAEREILIDAPAETVFRVITDYERYPDFLPEIRAAQVLRRDDGLVVVEFELDLIIRSTYILRLQEDPPDRVTWTLHSSRHLKKNSGHWDLHTTPEGRTRAVYGLEVELLGMLPRSVSERLAGPTLQGTLEHFRDRAQAAVTTG